MPETRWRRFLKGVRNVSGPLLWPTLSYAQEGEDMVLKRVFERSPPGFYVEVGAHHPFRFSNTYLFYRRGWSGICIDPLPGTVRRFARWRPRDIAVELGVSLSSSSLTYFMFEDAALNTFDPTSARRVQDGGISRIIEERRVATEPLARIVETHLPKGLPGIDFMSIDVEGLDLEVLRSNDWQRFAPRAVIAECSGSDLVTLMHNPISLFMSSVGYKPYAKTGHSVVFVEERSRNAGGM
jgi:FkbM family methyltransferase